MRFPLSVTTATLFCLAGGLAPVAWGVAPEGPDPMALLTQSGGSIESAPGVSVDLRIRTQMVRDTETDTTEQRVQYARGAEGQFLLVMVDPQGQVAPDGIAVRGNGDLTLTQVQPLGKHTLVESSEGIVPFLRSGMAQGIGGGLGEMVFSFFTPETLGEVAKQISSSEFVGTEAIDNTPHDRCRYTVGPGFQFDVWFTQGDKPLARRLQPDLSAMATSSPEAQQFDNFEYTMVFDFENWSLAPQFEAETFEFAEPEGSELVTSFFERDRKAPHPLLGTDAPLFVLNNLDGEEISLEQHLGKDVVVLDFWATWCPPCVAALPILDRITSSFAGQGVVFYALDQREEADAIRTFLEQRGINPPVLLDAEGTASDQFGVEGLPTSVIIGKDGKVQVVHVGFSGRLEKQLVKELEDLVAGKDLVSNRLAEHKARREAEQTKLQQLRQRLRDR